MFKKSIKPYSRHSCKRLKKVESITKENKCLNRIFTNLGLPPILKDSIED